MRCLIDEETLSYVYLSMFQRSANCLNYDDCLLGMQY